MDVSKRRPGYIPPIDPALLDAVERKYMDISYAEQSDAQKLDLYYPEEAADERGYPVIVYFHGGGFAMGSKLDEDLEPMLRAVKYGYVLVSADYRLAQEARFPAAIYDAKAVIRFLRANAAGYQLDASRIGVWGPSAGGWIVGMLGTTAGNPAFEDLSMGNAEYDSSVQAVMDWCGPCGSFLDLDSQQEALGRQIRRPHNDAHSPESQFLGAPIAQVPELCRLAAPINYVHKDVPPFYIVHGTADEAVCVEQSRQFYQALVDAAGEDRVQIYLAEGMPHHGNPWYTTQEMTERCMAFFDSVLK
ncbi:MAG: alpha/beta hydrolase [Lachnospiraceae bacterium]|nr:alpha/beta hydrolase [Lachnospiraceae bacterium]